MSDNIDLRICNTHFLQLNSEERLGDIAFYNGSVGTVVDIQEDITPKELSEIMIMIVLGTHAHNKYNWGKIIKDKKLERHFKEL